MPQWDAFCAAHAASTFWHHSRWLAYCEAYRTSNQNLSFAVMDEDHIVGVCPLMLEGGEFRGGGAPLGAMLTNGTVGACVPLYQELARLASTHGQTRYLGRTRPDPDELVTDVSWQTSVIDLMPREHQLWEKLRRSYKSLIHRAEDTYRIEEVPGLVGDMCCRHILRMVHAEAAGRVTRHVDTWRLMGEWMRDGYGLAVVAYTDAGQCAGFVYCTIYKGFAYYASGATLEKNMSHALLWHAILACKRRGVSYFEVGWLAREGDSPKDRAVAHFKEGFGGEPWTVPAVERRWASTP